MENEEVMGGTSDPVDKLIDVDEDDDDLVEVELEDVPVTVGTQKRKAKRRKTSAVWAFFEMLPAKGDGDKPCCRCKKCGNKYVSPGNYGTGTLKRHVESCYKKRTNDVAQLLLGNKDGSMSEIDGVVQKIRECIKYVKGSQGRKVKFFDSVKQMSLDGKKGLRQDVPTRQGSESEDEYVRRMAEQMLVKFEKYWSEFSIVLAIAVILDPRFKLQFVDFCYKKLYGVGGSYEYLKVREKLFALFGEYVSNVPTPSSTTNNRGKAVQDLQFKSFSKETMFVMKEFDCFESDDVVGQTQKTQLELYLEEPRMDRNAKLDILSFWKGNQFRYPELAAMVRDVLSIPISTVASESTFSVGGRVIDQFRSALKPDVVEALICSRDWLYGDKDLAESQLDDLTEDIMKMDINKENNDEPPSMGSNADMV
uniref:BED-type domain-containing protein n=1 Tax=Fagus sylvatica TaxID=28930 RepID=A0A2N9ETT1_FAGSY